MKQWKRLTRISSLCVLLTLLAIGVPAFSQVSPAEITKPNRKRAEQAHFQQLIDLNRAISQVHFPFPVVLSRYPGLDPKRDTTEETPHSFDP